MSAQRNQLNTEVIQNGSYPLTSKLFVIYRNNQGQAQQAGEAYTELLLTQQGQKAIAQAGFVPVNSQAIAVKLLPPLVTLHQKQVDK